MQNGEIDRALLAVESIKGQYNKYYAVYNEELRSKLLREKATDLVRRAAHITQ